MHSTHLFNIAPFLSLAFVALAMGFLTNEHDFLQKVCVFEGRVLFPGRRFKSDPCTTCRCPRRGGQVVCTVEDCRDQSNCLRLSNATSRRFKSCCPKCLEYGCRHTDGHVYRRGEIISRDGCSHCYCPWTGGPATCDVTQCPPIMCVDFVHQPGNCCPRCPKGEIKKKESDELLINIIIVIIMTGAV